MEVERRVSRYVMPSHVLRAELEGQEVLLNPETGVYHLVNETGRELLDGLRDGLTIQEARDMLIHAFAGDILDRVKIEPLRQALETELYAQLARDLAEVDRK